MSKFESGKGRPWQRGMKSQGPSNNGGKNFNSESTQSSTYQNRNQTLLFVNAIFDENPGRESIIAGNNSGSQKYFFDKNVFVLGEIESGKVYRFGIRGRNIINYELVTGGDEPKPETALVTSGVAMVAPLNSTDNSPSTSREMQILLLRTRTSPSELMMCYYWDHLAKTYMIPLQGDHQVSACNSVEDLVNLNLGSVEINEGKYIADCKDRIVNAFRHCRWKMCSWELRNYSVLCEGNRAVWADDMFEVWLRAQRSRVVSRHLSSADRADQEASRQRGLMEAMIYEEGFWRAITSAAGVQVSVLAQEVLHSRLDGQETGSEAAPSASAGTGTRHGELGSRESASEGASLSRSSRNWEQHWEVPKGKPGKDESWLYSAWRELWEECTLNRRAPQRGNPPANFGTKRTLLPSMGCILFKYKLESASDFPVHVITEDGRTTEHVEARWVPVSELPYYLDEDIASRINNLVMNE